MVSSPVRLPVDWQDPMSWEVWPNEREPPKSACGDRLYRCPACFHLAAKSVRLPVEAQPCGQRADQNSPILREDRSQRPQNTCRDRRTGGTTGGAASLHGLG